MTKQRGRENYLEGIRMERERKDSALSTKLDKLAGQSFYFIATEAWDEANNAVNFMTTEVGGFHDTNFAISHGRVIEMVREALALRTKLRCGMCNEFRGLDHTCDGGR